MMNSQFQSWFSEGKVADALCGFGDYFVGDVTYQEEHDFVLAVGQLLEWAKNGHFQDAAKGFEVAVTRLLQTGSLKSALRLMRSYGVLLLETGTSLPFDEERVVHLVGCSARAAGAELAHDENLRNLLLLVTQQFPSLRNQIGLK